MEHFAPPGQPHPRPLPKKGEGRRRVDHFFLPILLSYGVIYGVRRGSPLPWGGVGGGVDATERDIPANQGINIKGQVVISTHDSHGSCFKNRRACAQSWNNLLIGYRSRA